MRTVRDRLEDILEAIEAIQEIARRGRKAFATDRLIQVWMVHHIQIIGEAVRAVLPELKRQRPRVPWDQIVAMRHILVHDYFGIDLDEVWEVVRKDIPGLKTDVRQMLSELSRKPPKANRRKGARP